MGRQVDMDGKGGGEKMGEIGRGKTVIRIYYVRKERYFQIKEKEGTLYKTYE